MMLVLGVRMEEALARESRHMPVHFLSSRRGLYSSRRGLYSSRRGLYDSRRELKNICPSRVIYLRSWSEFALGDAGGI